MHFRGDLGFKQDLLIGGGSIKNRQLMHFLWGFRVKAFIAVPFKLVSGFSEGVLQDVPSTPPGMK